MAWLARLSFAQAVRWALVWPAVVFLTAATVAVGLVAAARWRGDWAFAFDVSSSGAVPVWAAVLIGACSVLFGPSVAFLALWKVAHR
jgi:hypothetical protein